MQFDDNPDMHENMRLEKAGEQAKANAIRDDFVARACAEIAQGVDFCSCAAECPYHGKCMECVLIHRGHRDHLPNCLKSVGK